MEMMNINEQIKAINYAMIFLKKEFEDIEKSIQSCNHETSKELLIKRKQEIEKDLILFESISDRF